MHLLSTLGHNNSCPPKSIPPFFHSEWAVTGYMAIQLETALLSLWQPEVAVWLRSHKWKVSGRDVCFFWCLGLKTLCSLPSLQLSTGHARDPAVTAETGSEMRGGGATRWKEPRPCASVRNAPAMQSWHAYLVTEAMLSAVFPWIHCALRSLFQQHRLCHIWYLHFLHVWLFWVLHMNYLIPETQRKVVTTSGVQVKNHWPGGLSHFIPRTNGSKGWYIVEW